MANRKTRKCAHIPCLCNVLDGEEYCGNACRDAGSDKRGDRVFLGKGASFRPLIVDRIKSAVNSALAANGWTLVSSRGDVEVFVVETSKVFETSCAQGDLYE